MQIFSNDETSSIMMSHIEQVEASTFDQLVPQSSQFSFSSPPFSSSPPHHMPS
jgi:hypothetical protein